MIKQARLQDLLLKTLYGKKLLNIMIVLPGKNYLFLPLAVEKIGMETRYVIQQKLVDVSGDGTAAGLLRQRICLAIQRKNAASLLYSLKSI